MLCVIQFPEKDGTFRPMEGMIDAFLVWDGDGVKVIHQGHIKPGKNDDCKAYDRVRVWAGTTCGQCGKVIV